MRISRLCVGLLLFPVALEGCAGRQPIPVSHEDYGQMSSRRHFDTELPVVWKAVEQATGKYQITRRDAGGAQERSLETDWIYGQSRDKHQSVTYAGRVTNLPLQSRVRYKVVAQRVLGGTDVQVSTTEELETVRADGSSNGYHGVANSERDTSRAQEVLDRVGLDMISAGP